jgi:hypothetical protein
MEAVVAIALITACCSHIHTHTVDSLEILSLVSLSSLQYTLTVPFIK